MKNWLASVRVNMKFMLTNVFSWKWTESYLTLCVYSDVVSIPKTNENFRLLYDTKGRFRLHSIRDEEAKVSF